MRYKKSCACFPFIIINLQTVMFVGVYIRSIRKKCNLVFALSNELRHHKVEKWRQLLFLNERIISIACSNPKKIFLIEVHQTFTWWRQFTSLRLSLLVTLVGSTFRTGSVKESRGLVGNKLFFVSCRFQAFNTNFLNKCVENVFAIITLNSIILFCRSNF